MWESSLQKIRKALVWLRRHFLDLKQPFAELRFLTDDGTVFLVDRDRDRESGPGQWRMQGHGLGGLGMVAGAAFGFHPKIGKNVQEISQFDATHDPGVDGHLPGGDILAAYLIRN